MIGFFAAGSYLGTLISKDSLFNVSIVLIILSISLIVLHFGTVLENQKVNLVNNT
jgi:DHA1 family bicyclomycin/chloramphenicol resistance-like MFS transporter